MDYANWLNLYDVPASSTLDPSPSVVCASSQTLSGTKEAGTSIILNGAEVAPMDSLTVWSCEMTLHEGRNPLSLYSRNLLKWQATW